MSAASTVVRTAEATPFTHGLDAMASSTLADRYADQHLVADIVLRYGPQHRCPHTEESRRGTRVGRWRCWLADVKPLWRPRVLRAVAGHAWAPTPP